MRARKRRRIPAAVALAFACALACGRPTGVPGASPGDQQKLPFDREAPSSGISPSRSLIPPTDRLSEGTPLLVRLQKPLSSASARAGDSFEGTLDEPVVVEGQTVIARGARVIGRVLDARHSGGTETPGYLRITLVSVDAAGRTLLIDTSSIFAKGGSHEERPSATGAALPSSGNAIIPPDRRLTFRLAQTPDSR